MRENSLERLVKTIEERLVEVIRDDEEYKAALPCIWTNLEEAFLQLQDMDQPPPKIGTYLWFDVYKVLAENIQTTNTGDQGLKPMYRAVSSLVEASNSRRNIMLVLESEDELPLNNTTNPDVKQSISAHRVHKSGPKQSESRKIEENGTGVPANSKEHLIMNRAPKATETPYAQSETSPGKIDPSHSVAPVNTKKLSAADEAVSEKNLKLKSASAPEVMAMTISKPESASSADTSDSGISQNSSAGIRATSQSQTPAPDEALIDLLDDRSADNIDSGPSGEVSCDNCLKYGKGCQTRGSLSIGSACKECHHRKLKCSLVSRNERSVTYIVDTKLKILGKLDALWSDIESLKEHIEEVLPGPAPGNGVPAMAGSSVRKRKIHVSEGGSEKAEGKKRQKA